MMRLASTSPTKWDEAYSLDRSRPGRITDTVGRSPHGTLVSDGPCNRVARYNLLTLYLL
jgi:hypothetical protein